jgi:hypothetical protein
MNVARMNWLAGVESIFSLSGNSYEYSPATDREAIADDWISVGNDMRFAFSARGFHFR